MEILISLLIILFFLPSGEDEYQMEMERIKKLPQPTLEDLKVGMKVYYFVGGIELDLMEIFIISQNDIERLQKNARWIKLHWARIEK